MGNFGGRNPVTYVVFICGMRSPGWKDKLYSVKYMDYVSNLAYQKTYSEARPATIKAKLVKLSKTQFTCFISF